MTGGHPPLVLHVFSTFAVGGPQVRTAAVINRFGARYRHAIIAMDGNYACRERIAPEIEVMYPHVPVNKGDTRGNRRNFRQFLCKMRPDVLVTSNWGTIEWAMANLPRVVRQVHIEDGFGPEEHAGQIRRRVLTRRLLLHWTHVVLPSRVLLRIASHIWKLPRQRLHYVPNGIDLRRFAAGHAPGSVPVWPGEGPVIGTVAALRGEKNIARMLRAFRLASAATPGRLVIVGDGPERAELERIAQEPGLNGRVHFTGHMADPGNAIRGFDLFALSSDTEQMPLSVLEAMAAGLPVASTDVGDMRAMLAEENAAFVTKLDDAALAAAMTALLRDAGLRRELGAANRAKAERDFDQETMFATYAALFDGKPLPARPQLPQRLADRRL